MASMPQYSSVIKYFSNTNIPHLCASDAVSPCETGRNIFFQDSIRFLPFSCFFEFYLCLFVLEKFTKYLEIKWDAHYWKLESKGETCQPTRDKVQQIKKYEYYFMPLFARLVLSPMSDGGWQKINDQQSGRA